MSVQRRARATRTPRLGWLVLGLFTLVLVWGMANTNRSTLSAASNTDPVRVAIPTAEVEARVRPLEVDGSGRLPPPDRTSEVGWWRAGPEPGEPGAAVLVGHVDSRTDPAVFFRIPELHPGAEITVTRADDSQVRFVVTGVRHVGKEEFPTEEVYGHTPDPQLRLVTCGGQFDRVGQRYLGNVIVFARKG